MAGRVIPMVRRSTVQEQTMDYKLELVVVPVTDVDRSKHFYSEMLGFHVDVDDSPNEQFRVVQLTPQGSGCSISIGIGLGDGVPGSLKGLQLSVADIDAARAELAGRGVPITPVRHHDGSGFVDGKGGDWNAFAFFEDPDGNSWALQESPTMRAAAAAVGSGS